MIKKVAPKLKEAELRECFTIFDVNGDQAITYAEFDKTIICNCDKQANYDEKKESANRLLVELKNIVKKKGLDVQKIFSNFDKDKNNHLDCKEFVKIMQIINNDVK